MASGEKRDARSLVDGLLKGGRAPEPATPEDVADAADAASELQTGDGPAWKPEAGSRLAGDGTAVAEEPSDAGERSADGPLALTGDDEEAVDLIDVYFELEEPEERDACFDQITALQSPLVQEFLRAVMEEDEDEYVRAAAAGELARRGDVSAAAALASDLEDPEEPFFFEHAVQVLAQIGGAAFYDRLAQIWRDPERDADQRRTAMLGMETADSNRALADFAAMLGGIDDIAAMPDDQVELAIATFVRHDHREAAATLTALRDKIAAADLEAEERRELVGLIEEGLDLLAAD